MAGTAHPTFTAAEPGQGQKDSDAVSPRVYPSRSETDIDITHRIGIKDTIQLFSDLLEEEQYYYPDSQTSRQQILWWDIYRRKGTNGPNSQGQHDIDTKPTPIPQSSGSNNNNNTGSIERYGNCQASNEEMNDFIRNQIPKNTIRKHRTDINQLRTWLNLTQSEYREIHLIPPNELDQLLSKYFYSTRKRDGTEYEPETLHSFFNSIDRVLRENKYQWSVKTDAPFEGTRRVLAAKKRNLKAMGKGNAPNKTEPLTADDIDELYNTGQLGMHSPSALQNTVWWFLTTQFGLRGVQEHYNMELGDIVEGEEVIHGDSVKYIEYNIERQTKTRQGENPRNTRKIKPRMYEKKANSDRCPVAAFKKFIKMRPKSMLAVDSPVYLAINYKVCGDGNWYKNQRLGINSLRGLMKTMALAANLSGKKTNHSARKTLVT
ncbi:uncharacterized protein KIAA1958-like [Ptychodera flava]|uniref:uncharacterized protein KIAA1958-like n=1 Tax=Ptychodera flava TaxID=63121 RepID=UPI00396A9DE4